MLVVSARSGFQWSFIYQDASHSWHVSYWFNLRIIHLSAGRNIRGWTPLLRVFLYCCQFIVRPQIPTEAFLSHVRMSFLHQTDAEEADRLSAGDNYYEMSIATIGSGTMSTARLDLWINRDVSHIKYVFQKVISLVVVSTLKLLLTLWIQFSQFHLDIWNYSVLK